MTSGAKCTNCSGNSIRYAVVLGSDVRLEIATTSAEQRVYVVRGRLCYACFDIR